MKFLILWTFLAFILLATTSSVAKADNKECGDPEKDGEIKAWFKNAGCTIKKSYEDISDSAKPYADQIATKAKELGNTVAQKYDEVKHKLTDSNDKPQNDGSSPAAVVEGPTEKVLLAPLSGQADAAAKPTTGEDTLTAAPKSGEPTSFDDRFLLQNNDCPKGQIHDHMNRCRPSI